MTDREAIEAMALICATTLREMGQLDAAGAFDDLLLRLDPEPGDHVHLEVD